jgi:hypothetical protein
LSNWERARKDINIELCMVVKGWRLMRLPELEGQRLALLSQNELSVALASLVGSLSPTGETARIFRNETITPSQTRATDYKNAKRTLLSAQAISPNAQSDQGILSMDPSQRGQRIGWSGPTPIGQVVKLEPQSVYDNAPNSAVIIYGFRQTRKARFQLTAIERESVSAQQTVDRVFVSANNSPIMLADGSALSIQVFRVPPGKWFVQGGYFNYDNCMGAPVFEAKAGSVTYMGTFDIRADKYVVDLNPQLVEGRLSPSLSTFSIAQWQNGYTYTCRQMLLYATEFEGFPFVEGYSWGSKANK